MAKTTRKPKRKTGTAPKAKIRPAKLAQADRRKAGKALKTTPTTKPMGERHAGTKQALLIARLRKGATIAQLTQATGWQAHSVRGAISGALKKKLGLAVTSRVIEGKGRVYRIV